MASQNDIPTKPCIVRGSEPYSLEEQLSGQNRVYRARASDGSLRIVKRYSTNASYLRERHALETLKATGGHPHLLSHIEFIEGKERYTIFPFIEGRTLHDRIEEEGTLTEKDITIIFAPICDAMQAMHEQSLVHRDVKASNILLGHGRDYTQTDGIECTITPYLFDFDITYHNDTAHLEEHNTISGTATHIAPENWKGHAPDPRTDVYAIGITLYKAATNKIPFVGSIINLMQQHSHMPIPDPRHDNKGISDGMRVIIMRCLQKDPDKRYQSARELKADIELLR